MEWRKQNKYHSESWLISDVAQRRLLVTFHNISQQTTNLHSIKSHNSQDLIYTMAEASNHMSQSVECPVWTEGVWPAAAAEYQTPFFTVTPPPTTQQEIAPNAA